MKKLYSWLLESNRLAHLAAGLLVIIYTMAFCILIDTTLTQMAWLTLWGSLIAGISAEVKDLQHKDKFDVLDILATILPSIIVLILVYIFP